MRHAVGGQHSGRGHRSRWDRGCHHARQHRRDRSAHPERDRGRAGRDRTGDRGAATTAATAPATTAATASAAPTICPTTTATAAATATATATAPAAAANVSCDIVVPANPLSAKGLSTPYQLTGTNGMSAQASGCTMANFGNLGAFVQATILNPATGALSDYEPLVITQGTTPAAAPVVPTLPAGAIVTIDFGFNGTNLTQVGATGTALAQGRCVNGLGGSIFGQVSFCNGTQFFQAAQRAEAAGTLVVPATGTSTKAAGVACPTARNFNMIDQDQSDNVTSHVPAHRQRPDGAVQRGQPGRAGRGHADQQRQ